RYIAHSHFICADALRDLHSFPTRRSSDLLDVRHDDEIEEHPLQPRRAHHDCDDQSKLPRHRVELARHPDPRRAFGEFGSFELLLDRKSTRLNSSHVKISYAVFCLKKKTSE